MHKELAGPLDGREGQRRDAPGERPASAAGPVAGAAQDCCDRCGSVRLIRVKACWRCEACGYKSDCNGW